MTAFGQRGAEDKAARFNAGHRINQIPFRRRQQRLDGVDSRVEVVAQQRRDIAKQNTGLREVRYVSNESLQLRQRYARWLMSAAS